MSPSPASIPQDETVAVVPNESAAATDPIPEKPAPAREISISDYLDDDEDDEPDTLPMEIINRLKHEFRGKNKTEFLPANIRNILFCGATRSGKTTTYRVFMDPAYVPETSSIFSETQDTTFKTFALRDNHSKRVHEYIVNLIDSPGIFELHASDDDFQDRSIEEITGIITKCLENEITYLNMVVLFMPLSTVNQKDVDAIDYFSRMFDGCGLPIKLCITHADMVNAHKREAYVSELKRHPRLKHYFENKLSVLFMGCVDHRHQNYPTERAMKRMYAQVMLWRQAFLDEIFNCVTRVDLKSTNIYKDKAEAAKTLLTECTQELNRLMSMDKEVAQYKQAVFVHGEKMARFFNSKMMLGNEPEVVEMQHEFIQLIQSIRKSGESEFVKKELISPWRV